MSEHLKSLWLFDLEADPTEQTDVSAQHPQIVARLRARLDEFRAEAVEPYERYGRIDPAVKRERGPGTDPITGQRVFDQWLDRIEGGTGTMQGSPPSRL